MSFIDPITLKLCVSFEYGCNEVAIVNVSVYYFSCRFFIMTFFVVSASSAYSIMMHSC